MPSAVCVLRSAGRDGISTQAREWTGLTLGSGGGAGNAQRAAA